MNDRPAAPVLRSFLEGTWYPAARQDWEREVPLLFEGGRPAPDPAVRAVVVPHAGVRYSGNTAALAYRRIADDAPRVVVVFGPSHFHGFEGASCLRAAAYETPFGRLESARDLREELQEAGVLREVDEAHAREHSVDIQLPFLKAVSPEARVLPIILGDMGEGRREALVGALLEVLPESARFVASTDFTHYGGRFGYWPQGDGTPGEVVEAIDRESFRCLEARDGGALQRHQARTGTNICGIEALHLLLALGERLDLDPHLLGSARSGDLLDDWSSSVSYGALACEDGTVLTKAERDHVLCLAREHVIAAARGESATVPTGSSTLSLGADRGAFVTLRREGRLRACMGSLAGRPDLAGAIQAAAANAARQDPRFDPVTSEELAALTLEITVLTRPVRLMDPLDVVLGRDGVVLERAGQRATFLPQVAHEHGLDVEGLWRALCRKAGIAETCWREPGVRHRRYRGEVVGPVPVLSSNP